MKKKIYEIIEDNSTKKGRQFDYFIQGLILLSLISFSLDTLPGLSEKSTIYLKGFEFFSITIFSIEYVLRLYVSKNRIKYIFSFYGLIDLIAIVPFFLNSFIDLRFLRVFRVFRVFRALKLIRYNKAIRRFGLAFKIVKEEIVLFFIVTLIMIFITSAGIYFFENDAQPEVFKPIFHSAWWSIVTLTTVGYGDVYPITVGGRIFTFFVLMIGVGLVTIPAGLIASSLSKARELEDN